MSITPEDPASPVTGLPKIPERAADGPLVPPPSRATTWARRGGAWAAAVGAVGGGFLAKAELERGGGLTGALALFAGSVAGLAAAGACVWGLRGFAFDRYRRGDDREAREVAERRREQDQGWAGVHEAMRRRGN